MTAGTANDAGECQLVKADQSHAEQPIRRLSKGALPVSSLYAAAWRIVPAIGAVAHDQLASAGIGFSIWSRQSTTASKVSMVEAWRAL